MFSKPQAAEGPPAEDLDLRRVARAQGAGEKSLYVETYGCQMNERDTDALATLMAAHGYRVTEKPEDADLLFLNTCSVREKAEHKTWSDLGRLRLIKNEKPQVRIAVLGCVAQQMGEDMVRRNSFVDLVIGTHNVHAIPDMLEERERTGKPVIRADFHSEEQKIFRPAEILASGRVAAFVNIMVGCDHKCTYCIVPQTRGPEISRKPEDILAEVRQLAEQGVREVTLLGQNVNSYGKQWAEQGPDFGQLVLEVAKIPEIWRVRFTTPHPVNVGESLYRAFAECEKLQSHLHLPVQSGSDKILRRMKREYGVDRYREVVRRIRAARPGIALTTDIIVGFPGETDEDFEATIALMKEVEYDSAYSFIYSPRPETAALRLSEAVPPELARERLARLQLLQEEMSARAAKALEGNTQEILVEGRSRRRDEEVCGRTGGNWLVNFPGRPEWTGRRVPVRITKGLPHTLRGEALA
ncbi:MAG: tRNA (N6-isopentenyl adenosine(37)-C2)-methylthiotransferase MiaB [Bdellovibrionota bacterium]